MATFTAGATFTSTANNLLESALNLSATKSFTTNMDAGYNTIYIAANSTQSAYSSPDSAGSTAENAFLYIRNSATNHSSCDVQVVYASASANVYIGNLKPGDWMYLPYKRQVDHPASSSLKLVNSSTVSGSYLTVLYAESGSI